MREYPDEFSRESVAVFRTAMVDFIRERMSKKGFSRVIFGMSGGVDSTLGAFLAVEALGCENVTGVFMPYKSSSPESLEHAALAAEKLEIETTTIEITPIQQFIVDLEAYPCISSSIFDLWLCEGWIFPVGNLLVFGDPIVQKECGEVPGTNVFYAKSRCDLV